MNLLFSPGKLVEGSSRNAPTAKLSSLKKIKFDNYDPTM